MFVAVKSEFISEMTTEKIHLLAHLMKADITVGQEKNVMSPNCLWLLTTCVNFVCVCVFFFFKYQAELKLCVNYDHI